MAAIFFAAPSLAVGFHCRSFLGFVRASEFVNAQGFVAGQNVARIDENRSGVDATAFGRKEQVRSAAVAVFIEVDEIALHRRPNLLSRRVHAQSINLELRIG